jgi:acyl-coenzyme A thioesterase PaaI-like protein
MASPAPKSLASGAFTAALADTDAGCQCYPTLSGVAMPPEDAHHLSAIREQALLASMTLR